jgi:uncharacterized protein (TIGR00730 family)
MVTPGKVIGVFGSSRRVADSALYAEAYDLGQQLARAGYRVLTGGYGGSMAAVSRGAAEADGQVIGATCALFDPLAPNEWLTEEIKSPDLLARLACIMEQSDGFITLRGGIGTLSEVTLAWSLLQTRSLRDKPLILLGADWRAIVDCFLEHTDMGSSIAMLAQVVDTPADAIAALAAPPPTPLGPPPLG